jgi:hypothetical protein
MADAVIGDHLDAADAMRSFFSRPPLAVGVDSAPERHDAVLHGHADLAGRAIALSRSFTRFL